MRSQRSTVRVRKREREIKNANAASVSVEADTDSNYEPRYKRLHCVGRPFAEFAAGYEMVTNQVQLKAMRDVRTVFGPEGRLQRLGSAALLSKEEELTMGTDYEPDEARCTWIFLFCLRTRGRCRWRRFWRPCGILVPIDAIDQIR